MSTEMKSTSAFHLTTFSGGGERKMQVTEKAARENYGSNHDMFRYVSMTRVEAAELGMALLQFAAGTLEEDYE